MREQITIIVITYNRPNSLARLLASLAGAHYKVVPDLIISIDYSEESARMRQIASDFAWNGMKEIFVHEKNLGLKEHILACSLMARQYGTVLLLEDDLIVSPYFYEYAVCALKDTQGVPDVAGISLYSPSFNEAAFLPFYPLITSSHYYLLQMPSSWGLVWTQEQIEDFHLWYCSEFKESMFCMLPEGIKQWSEQSWKKIWVVFLLCRQKYFAYPYHSYSLNLNEPGSNTLKKESMFINNMVFQFPGLSPLQIDKAPRYDAAYNLSPTFLNTLSHPIKNVSFQVDFFGSRLDSIEEEEYVLTCLPCSNTVQTFGVEVLPLELNVLMDIKGEGITLARKKDISSRRVPVRIIRFLFPIPEWYLPLFYPPLKRILREKFSFYVKRLIRNSQEK